MGEKIKCFLNRLWAWICSISKKYKEEFIIILGSVIILACGSYYAAIGEKITTFQISELTKIENVKSQDVKSQEFEDANLDISNWLYFVTGLATALLTIIAYSNLASLNKTNKNKQLLQIDQRWGSPEIIKARQIIHVIYRAVCDEVGYEDPKNNANLTREKDVYPKISEIIIQMSIDEDVEIRKAFVYLLNYLDLMDSLGYIYIGAGLKEIEELDAFCGETLMFNYGVFYGYLKYRENKHKDVKENFSKHFQNIVKSRYVRDKKNLDIEEAQDRYFTKDYKHFRFEKSRTLKYIELKKRFDKVKKGIHELKAKACE